jgi:hypothetical protein
MLTAWILGSLFFVFVVGFTLVVFATDVSQPEPAGQSRAGTAGTLLSEPAAAGGKRLISRDYQIVFSPKVFVNYPFGVRMVFARPGRPEPATTGNPGPNHRPAFQESEYYGWPQLAVEDPELSVVRGHIEFEAEEAAPTIRVELKQAGESFQAIETVAERVLKCDGDIVFSFWLNPLEPEVGSLKVMVSHIPGEQGAIPPAGNAGNGRTGHELAAIPLTVSATPFPIALR